jgi:cytochrome d ubiquinol oxidase subunit II
MFLDSTISIICIVLASLLIPLFWWSINKHKKNLSRILAGLQTFFIVIGWFAVQYPVLIRTTGEDLSVYNTAAPDAVMVQLLIALVVGIMLILPAFFYLFRVFKKI